MSVTFSVTSVRLSVIGGLAILLMEGCLERVTSPEQEDEAATALGSSSPSLSVTNPVVDSDASPPIASQPQGPQLRSTGACLPILVPGPNPVPPFGGTTIDFEGWGEGTFIDLQYAAMGGTFTQDDGGRPMIDNSPFLYAFESGAGDGVLTGSQDGGAPFPTIAGLIAEFPEPVCRAGAFMSDTGPLGNYTVKAFDAMGTEIGSIVVAQAQFPSVSGFPGYHPDCDQSSPFEGTGCGVWVGFDCGSNEISKIQFGPSDVSGDAFAIDNLVFDTCGHEVSLDIKPTSCPNPLNAKSRGLTPVALVGTDTFDATQIDVSTVQLEGVDPVRGDLEDVATPLVGGEECDCTTDGPDGLMDLTLKFSTQDLVTALGDFSEGDVLVLTVTGNLLDGTPFVGTDCMIVRSDPTGPPRDPGKDPRKNAGQ